MKGWTKGLAIAGTLLLAGAAGLLLYRHSRQAHDASQDKAGASKGGVYSQSQSVSEIKARKEDAAAAKRSEAPAPEPPRQRSQAQPLPLELDLFTGASSSKEPAAGKVFAPYGRLIKCRLVMTVDSSRLQTPVIAEVMEELWNTSADRARSLVVERGVEVHGTSQGSPMRDRIATGTDWILVWRNADSPDAGKELRLKGIALECSQEPDAGGFTITDGSAGIPGYAIQGSELKETMALISTFVSGLGAGLVQSETYTGTDGTTTTSYDGNMKTAMALGVQRAAELYAQRMLRRVAEDSCYVRAPAGTPFYLYVMQTLDPAKAPVAGTELDKDSKDERRGRAVAARPARQAQAQERQGRQ